jgi:Zn finger protein HypA/HybF involved in hydrogenase expression
MEITVPGIAGGPPGKNKQITEEGGEVNNVQKIYKCEKCNHRLVTCWAKYLSPCPKCKGRMVEQK